MNTTDIYKCFRDHFPEIDKRVKSYKPFGIRGIELNLGGAKLIFKVSSNFSNWRLETPDYYKTTERNKYGGS